jgi:hypothetical protein
MVLGTVAPWYSSVMTVRIHVGKSSAELNISKKTGISFRYVVQNVTPKPGGLDWELLSYSVRVEPTALILLFFLKDGWDAM